LVERDVLFGLAQGNKVLKEIQKEMSLESVEKLMDETAEAVAYQKEVGEMLAGTMTNADEDEVQEEMERMEQEEALRVGKKVDVGGKLDLPEVPKGVPEREEEEVVEERRERQLLAA
jgi:charged multivesicular body protein 6